MNTFLIVTNTASELLMAACHLDPHQQHRGLWEGCFSVSPRGLSRVWTFANLTGVVSPTYHNRRDLETRPQEALPSEQPPLPGEVTLKVTRAFQQHVSNYASLLCFSLIMGFPLGGGGTITTKMLSGRVGT